MVHHWPFNVMVITICVLSVERYVAICHPFLAAKHKLSSRKRAIKIIILIWLAGFLCALPLSLQHTSTHLENDPHRGHCTIIKKNVYIYTAAVHSLFFILFPSVLLCVMYALIGRDMKKSAKSIYGSRQIISSSERRVPKILSILISSLIIYLII